jgi:hypothetical protein
MPHIVAEARERELEKATYGKMPNIVTDRTGEKDKDKDKDKDARYGVMPSKKENDDKSPSSSFSSIPSEALGRYGRMASTLPMQSNSEEAYGRMPQVSTSETIIQLQKRRESF